MKTFHQFIVLILFTLMIQPAWAQTEVPNGDFEVLNDTLPQGWDTQDFGSGLSDAYSYTGTYSIAVWNWYYYAKGWTVNGTVPAGSVGGLWSYGDAGTPIDIKPIRLTGYYLYDTTNNGGALDTAYVAVLLKRYDTTWNKVDTVGFGETYLLSTAMQGGMQPFEVVINDLMPGVEPDSAAVYLQSSLNGFCNTATSGNCLYLYADKLAFETTTGTEDITGWFRQIKTYPNPAQDQLIVESAVNATLRIYSLDGKLLQQQNLNAGNLNMDISSLALGMYLLEFSQNGEVLQREKLLVE